MKNIQEKECSKCRLIKSLDEFYNTMSGKWTECKSCTHLKQRIRNKDTERKCKICKIIKSIEEFGRHANNSRRTDCIECYEKFTPIEQKNRDFLSKERHRQSDLIYKYSYGFKRRMFTSARLRARQRGLDFNLEYSDIIIPEFCPVLGIPIASSKGGTSDGSPTLDRIDNKGGYTKDNVRIISWKANSLKRDGKVLDFERIVFYMKESVVEDFSI